MIPALLLALAIAWVIPKNLGFPYAFEKGQVWQNNNLVAEFDFAIEKTAEELESEKQELLASALHHYRIDSAIGLRQIDLFEQHFDEFMLSGSASPFTDLRKRPLDYKRFGSDLLHQILLAGYYTHDTLLHTQNRNLILVRGLFTYRTSLDSFYEATQVSNLLPRMMMTSKMPDADAVMPLIVNHLTNTLIADNDFDNQANAELIESISKTRGLFSKDSVIVNRNMVVNDEIYQTLVSYRNRYQGRENRSQLAYFLGYLTAVALCLGLLMWMLFERDNKTYRRLPSILFIVGLLAFFVFITHALLGSVIEVWLLPYALVPLFINHFYNSRLALAVHVVMILMIDAVMSLGHGFVIIQLLAGLTTVALRYDLRFFNQFFRVILAVLSVYISGSIASDLMSEGAFSRINWLRLPWLLINALLSMLVLPLIPLVGRLTGITSAFRLSELSDMNHPLLAKLANEAPGTYQHSVNVANLAVAAGKSIGANDLLLRVGAMYHDIGKIKNPAYFIENQQMGNPHDAHNPLQSARIIIGHVAEGVAMAKASKLPEELIRFIRTHHGTTTVAPFLSAYQLQNPGLLVDVEQFRYPGPRPRTREESILMLADSLEASSRSLTDYNEADITELVNRILSAKLKSGQFEESLLTYAEMQTIKHAFIRMLRNTFHKRNKYPEAPKNDDGDRSD